jgi:hypothetical protein
MKSMLLNKMRDWGFPVVVLVTWFLAFGYTLMRLGEASRSHGIAADATASAAPDPVSASPYVASAK